MKLLITMFAAVMLSSQPLLVEAQTAPPAHAAHPKPAVAATKVAGTQNAVIGSTAISGGEIGLYAAGALFVAVAAAGGGSSHKGGSTDCHCGSGGGTTGTTGTH